MLLFFLLKILFCYWKCHTILNYSCTTQNVFIIASRIASFIIILFWYVIVLSSHFGRLFPKIFVFCLRKTKTKSWLLCTIHLSMSAFVVDLSVLSDCAVFPVVSSWQFYALKLLMLWVIVLQRILQISINKSIFSILSFLTIFL